MGYSLSIQSSSNGDIQFNLAANANARAPQRTQVLHGQNGTLTINGRSREAVIASLLNEIKHLRQGIRHDFPHPEQLTSAQRSFFQVRVRQVSEMMAEAASFIDHTYGRQIPNAVRRNYRSVLNDTTWKNYLASTRNRDLYTGRPTPNLELGRIVDNPGFTDYRIIHLQTSDPGRFTAAIERRFLQHYLTASRALDRIPQSLANERDIQIYRSSLANARTLLNSLSSHPNHDHWQTGLAALERSFGDALIAGLPNDPVHPTRLSPTEPAAPAAASARVVTTPAPTAPAETFEQRHHIEIDRIEQLAVAVEQHIAIPELAEARTTLEQAETALAALQRSAGGSEINLMRRLQNQVAGAGRDLGIEERDVSFHNLLERAGQVSTQDQANLFFNEAQNTLRAMHQPGVNVRRLAMLQRNLQRARQEWQRSHPNHSTTPSAATAHAVPAAPVSPTPPTPPAPPAPPRSPAPEGLRPRPERFEVVHAGDIGVFRAALAIAATAQNQEAANRNLAPARGALARISWDNGTGSYSRQRELMVRRLLSQLAGAERRIHRLPAHPPAPIANPVSTVLAADVTGPQAAQGSGTVGITRNIAAISLPGFGDIATTPRRDANGQIEIGGTGTVVQGGPASTVMRTVGVAQLPFNVGASTILTATGVTLRTLSQREITTIRNAISAHREALRIQSARIAIRYEPNSTNQVRIIVLSATYLARDPGTGRDVTLTAQANDPRIRELFQNLNTDTFRTLFPQLSSPAGTDGSMWEFNL